MKNAFKLGFLALALSLSVVACKSEKKDGAADSSKVDSTVVDTTVKDTTVKDSTVKDTLAKDSTKK
ncbi:hypothetical protein G7074_20685 [Pedobacter sp. HDW13]|uniref:hypothetical protein n=1 Tax=unclassified Pedobacter TaxID=2628915 RepID=UPI000F5B2BF1|nr:MULTISPECIES: hypothetical protein [unclassified Pedobacter]QIL41467.1 hypothetical protein G7074_20685 [Pedobacter sp. HDW13]RQO77955.1 hypothetical protein DBR40_08335 [Pedobacter sp. KBW01]